MGRVVWMSAQEVEGVWGDQGDNAGRRPRKLLGLRRDFRRRGIWSHPGMLAELSGTYPCRSHEQGQPIGHRGSMPMLAGFFQVLGLGRSITTPFKEHR